MAGNPGGGGGQPAPKGGSMSWMFIFLFMMIILLNRNTRQVLGEAIGILLNPLIGFGGVAPIWTIFVGTLVIVALSQSIRHFMTDWIKLARNQNLMKAFNKELNEARKNQNQQRVSKLQELQPKMMQNQMDIQGMTMKPSIFTMAFFIAFITWIYTFVDIAAVDSVSLPWNAAWKLEATSIFSSGLIIYILFTIPLSQMVVNIWKYISFSKRLRALEAKEAPEVTI
jgi:uncharacterized membrane protein (DUF106 family)